jgi:competence protein ComEC
MSSPAPPLRAPLLWILLPLMAGITMAGMCPASGFTIRFALLAAGGLAIAGLWLTASRPHLAMGAVVIAASLAGFVLLHLRYPQLHHWESRPPREATLTVKVTRLFGHAPGSRSIGGLAIVIAAGPSESGLLGQPLYFSAIQRISVPPRDSGEYRMHGVLEPLPRDAAEAGFNDYLANHGVRQRLIRARILRETSPPGTLARGADDLRSRFAAILWHGLARHPQVVSLYLAMLLGEKAALDPAQENAFMRSGTFHVFSVSGLHVGVIAVALQMLLMALRVPRRPGAVLSLLVLWLYVVVTGGGTPSTRAFVMSAALVAAHAFQLPGNALSALTASALGILLADPLQLFSTGFQMSYAVVAALLLMGTPLADRWLPFWRPFVLRPRPEWRWWHEFINWSGRKAIAAVAGSWAAFLAGAAPGIGFFGVFSPGSLVANLLVLPLSSLVIVAGFLSILTGLVGLVPLSALFNSAAAMLLLATDWLVRHGTELPGVYFPGAFRHSWLGPAALVLMVAAMLAGASARWKLRYGGFWPPFILLVLLLIFGVKFG